MLSAALRPSAELEEARPLEVYTVMLLGSSHPGDALEFDD